MCRLLLLSSLSLLLCNGALADGVEILAQKALEKYTKQWLTYPAHKTEVHGSKTTEWDEYSLKSPNLQHFILRKYYSKKNLSNENAYEVFQIDKHGVIVAKPSDDELVGILRYNKILTFESYADILENVEQYKKDNIKASLKKVTEPAWGEEIEIGLLSRGQEIGVIIVRENMSYFKTEVSGSALAKVDQGKIAYFAALEIREDYQGRGLSYPLMCVAFLAAKEAFRKDYVILVDTSSVVGIYEKMGFLRLGDTKHTKYAAINDLLNSDKCRHLNR